MRRRTHPLDEQHRPALAEHDLVAQPDRHRLADAFAVQVRAVLTLGISHDQTAGRADRQLGMNPRHDGIVGCDGLDFALSSPPESDAGAARVVPLAGRGR